MELSTDVGFIQNFKREKSLQISHLLFADDMLVFCRANKKSFKGVNDLLDKMGNNTGLSINRDKSKVYFSKGCSNIQELLNTLKISEGKLPVRYLGLPLSINYPKAMHFLPLLDKLRAQVGGWASQSLSFAGRLELIKSVLFGNLSYWFQTLAFPISISNEIERILGNFLWKDSLHTISWGDICKLKSEAGLGIMRVQDMCKAAGLKMVWRFLNSNSLWSSWMERRYLKGSSFWESSSRLLDSGTWKLMTGLIDIAQSCMRKRIGNGHDTLLWYDPWVKEGRLVDLLSHDMPIISDTDKWTVSRLLINSQWCCTIPGLHSVWNFISNVNIYDGKDDYMWTEDTSGGFSLKSAWNFIRDQGIEFQFHNLVWFPNSSPKMSCSLLKCLLDRLPTRSRLVSFRIIDTATCVLCDDGIETRDHLFFECPFSAYIWSLCKLKLKLPSTLLGNMHHEADLLANKFREKDVTYQLSRMALAAAVWHIWKERSRRIFQQQSMHKILVFRRVYEDVTILIRTCHWKVNYKEDILANWSVHS
jgi:hypothetical protein